MKNQRGWLNLSIISLIFFIVITLIIFTNGFLVGFDLLLNSLIPRIQLSSILIISKIISIIFDTWVLMGITLLCSVYLWFKDSKKDSIFFIITMAIGAGAIFTLKDILLRARPLNILINETNSSFPSGHATIAVIFFGILSYLIWTRRKSLAEKIIALVISSLLILFIGFSRIYLNAHWLTDVLAGFCLGLFILSICIIVRKRFNKL